MRLLLLIGLVLGPGISWAAGAPPAAMAREASLGQELYGERCSSCHGLLGQGTDQGPSLAGAGPAAVDFMLSTGRMPLADPRQPMLRQSPRFTRREIDALLAYIASLGSGGPSIPSVDLTQGNLVRGRQLFMENCAACHGADGQGAAVNLGEVAPSLHIATPTEIAEAVRTGPGPMPRFGEKVFDQSDLDSLVRYVYALRNIPDPGGAGLGHEGPVIEGFVAWLVGLGLMVLLTRMIGTTT